jgi:hypothetical protein
MELKGQMVFCPESDSLLFVASPFLDGLEGLTSRGLYISDIPIHDATRDVILVGEQSRAQVSNALTLSALFAAPTAYRLCLSCMYSAFQPLSRGPNISFALDAIQTLVRRLININQRARMCRSRPLYICAQTEPRDCLTPNSLDFAVRITYYNGTFIHVIYYARILLFCIKTGKLF